MSGLPGGARKSGMIMVSEGYGRRWAGVLRMLLQHWQRGVAALDARLVALFPDAPETKDRCPVCGGTDHFDGEGTCQICEAI